MAREAKSLPVLLARHGQTDDNVEPLRFQGWRDTPLNDTGRRQAAELAERLVSEGIVSLWSSDMVRASETAEIVGARLRLEPRLDWRLREANRGQAVSARRLALAAWTLLVTNVPRDRLTLPEALVLVRARWQIELLFKLWKQHGRVDEWRSTQPWRVLCEVYAKLLGALVQHWCLQRARPRPDRSVVQAARTVCRYAPLLALAHAGRLAWTAVLSVLDHALAHTGRLNPRRARPNLYQLMLDPHLGYP